MKRVTLYCADALCAKTVKILSPTKIGLLKPAHFQSYTPIKKTFTWLK